MQTELREAKAALRRQIGTALAAMSPEQRAAGSAKICARLRELAVWQNAKLVLLFAPMPVEPDIWPLLAEVLGAGKTAALPRYHPADKNYVACRVQNVRSDIVTGQFGIREPAARCPEIPLSRFDLILVPGVAFDGHGHRLGHGKGYYDRLLAGAGGVKCGIAFDEQMVNEIPTGPSDAGMNFILTPTRGAEIAGRAAG
jgi:5-formyltetrahydrofolate cyclo-ligase